MNQDITLRPYEPGDEEAIIGLFRTVYGRPMTPDYWRWRFLQNPQNRVLIELAWKDAELIAHYAVSPLTLTHQGTDLPAALSLTTMTHPAYQGRGLFTQLARDLYERLTHTGTALIIGFPNANSHRTFIRDLGWTDIHEIPTLTGPARTLQNHPACPRITQTTHLDHDLDQLLTDLTPPHRYALKKDAAYLNWRYSQHPHNHYTTHQYTHDGQPLGYAITKPYGPDTDIVDLLCRDHTIALKLITHIAQHTTPDANIRLWLPLTNPLHRELERHGYTNQPPITYLGAKTLSLPDSAELANPHNWCYTMGDSDVY
jgi:GNAT superfamily N-acetyltransferase